MRSVGITRVERVSSAPGMDGVAAATLARARRDLQYAVLSAGDPYRCRQYALSALDEACSVLLAGDAAALQRRYAGLYFRAAQQLARTADNAAPIPTRGEPLAGDLDRADNSWIPLESSTSEGRG